MTPIRFEQINEKIITFRNNQVIIDSDVAELYGVETKEINQAVRNNPEKFPQGYILLPSAKEWQKLKITLIACNRLTTSDSEDLRSKILTAKFAKMRSIPKIFTEQGLYMLATILKGPQAVQTTIAIINAFTKLRQLSRNIQQLQKNNNQEKQKSIVQQSGQIIEDLLYDDLEVYDSETTIELNLALLKLKQTIKKKRPKHSGENQSSLHQGDTLYLAGESSDV